MWTYDLYNLYAWSYLYSYMESRDSIIYSRIYSHSNLHNHSTRNRNNLALPHCNKSQSSCLYQSIRRWNILPDHVKSHDTLFKFKHKLKEYYFWLYWFWMSCSEWMYFFCFNNYFSRCKLWSLYLWSECNVCWINVCGSYVCGL